MDELTMKRFKSLELNELTIIDGGINLDFISPTIKTIWDCGYQFGFNVVNFFKSLF